jgi:excisionase family DNA binding protein
MKDAAKFLGVSESKLQRLVAGGHIRYVVDPGGVRMYPTSELKKYVEKQMEQQWGQVA